MGDICLIQLFFYEAVEETLEEGGVDMYVHYADKCYPTYEEAEKIIVGSEV